MKDYGFGIFILLISFTYHICVINYNTGAAVSELEKIRKEQEKTNQLLKELIEKHGKN